jgi:hypothetical protein
MLAYVTVAVVKGKWATVLAAGVHSRNDLINFVDNFNELRYLTPQRYIMVDTMNRRHY